MEYLEDIKGIDDSRLSRFIAESLKALPPAGNILVLFPDYTRVDFSHIIAPAMVDRHKGSHIDFLNAGGTHRPMTDTEFADKLHIGRDDPKIRFLNHNFSDPAQLVTIGKIGKKLVSKKTQGQLDSDIDITVNKLLFDSYDLIIALSGTVPHEAAGYSGGLKIFFPGVSGPDVIDTFHWAAVLVGIPEIIGTVDNNARDIINRGAEAIFKKIDCPIYSFNMVNTESKSGAVPLGLYIDKGFEGFVEAYKKAAHASSKAHVKYIEKPLSRVVQVIPRNYDEIWLAGKGSYKLQRPGVLTKGAEVIIYAPHIKCFHTNPDMEADLYSLGYHCRDHVCSLIEEGADPSKNAAAHLINVCGPGIFDPDTKKEDLAFKVILATSIPEDKCRKVGLGYMDPATVNRKDYEGPGKLWIDEGGKYLYEIRGKEN
jgi:nickel-dependent lactate racemase